MVIFLSSQPQPRMFDETPNKEFPAEQSIFTVLFSNFPSKGISNIDNESSFWTINHRYAVMHQLWTITN